MRDWRAVAEGHATAAELRKTFVHAHVVPQVAIGRAGIALVRARPNAWMEALAGLDTLNWLRSSTALSEGRALVGGRVSKTATSVVLTGNALKLHLGLELGPEEVRLEEGPMPERRRLHGRHQRLRLRSEPLLLPGVQHRLTVRDQHEGSSLRDGRVRLRDGQRLREEPQRHGLRAGQVQLQHQRRLRELEPRPLVRERRLLWVPSDERLPGG
jgi:hypothetical protein